MNDTARATLRDALSMAHDEQTSLRKHLIAIDAERERTVRAIDDNDILIRDLSAALQEASSFALETKS